MGRYLIVLLLAGCFTYDCDDCIDPYQISPNTSFSHECTDETVEGICVVNRTLVVLSDDNLNQIDKMWDSAKSCLSMNAQLPTIEFLPLDYFHPSANGYMFNNGYISVAHVDIVNLFFISRHEFLHYLLLKKWQARI